MPWEKIWRRVRYGAESGEEARDWMAGVSRSSAKRKVFGAEVARVTRSTAARGDEADLESARNGYGKSERRPCKQTIRGRTSRALRALVCSMVGKSVRRAASRGWRTRRRCPGSFQAKKEPP